MQHPGARYLIRLDDISPASNWPRLLAIEEFLNSMAIQPIVAVVPDNRDRELMKHPPDPAFWSHIRRWQDRGWSIGVHGLHHTLSVPDGGLLQLNRRSEFAGVPEEIQYGKIRRAACDWVIHNRNRHLDLFLMGSTGRERPRPDHGFRSILRQPRKTINVGATGQHRGHDHHQRT